MSIRGLKKIINPYSRNMFSYISLFILRKIMINFPAFISSFFTYKTKFDIRADSKCKSDQKCIHLQYTQC